MNEYIKSGIITELKGMPNVQYVFNEDRAFSLTEFKVLKGQSNEFVKCAKVLYNGKTKVVYFTSGLKSLKNMIATLDSNSFLMIISNIINAIINIKSNGFLNVTDLDLSFDKIFVDQNTLAVSLVYLPINSTNPDSNSFENEFKTELVKCITTYPSFDNDKMKRVCGYLSNGMFSLSQLLSCLKNEISGTNSNVVQDTKPQVEKLIVQNVVQPTLRFNSVNTPVNVSFIVNTPEFVIGKSHEKANGVISFNNAISRVHCKITYQNEAYYITDLGSANGTFVNGNRLSPQISNLIKNGDMIRLANSDFKIML